MDWQTVHVCNSNELAELEHFAFVTQGNMRVLYWSHVWASLFRSGVYHIFWSTLPLLKQTSSELFMMQLPYLSCFPLPFFTHFSLKCLNTHMLESNYITTPLYVRLFGPSRYHSVRFSMLLATVKNAGSFASCVRQFLAAALHFTWLLDGCQTLTPHIPPLSVFIPHLQVKKFIYRHMWFSDV